jgi:serine-type D-Ala-D-Ala carboxypeptidase/endopeptidase
MMFKPMARAAALLLALLCGVVNAQPQDFSDPVKLAKIALGDEQGSVAVGVLQRGASQRAFMHRSGKNAVVATSADGSPVGTSADATAEQLFEIGSITKVFTGLLLAQAVEKGDLSLDDSLGKLLAGTVNFQSSATAAISLRQLITHSACLPRSAPGQPESLDAADPYASLTRREMWDALSSFKLESPSPCAAAYSNFGLALVGELLSHHHSKPWADLVSERITTPLGMKDTVQVLGNKAPRFAQGYNNQAKVAGWEFKAMAGAGALRSTVSDMLIFSRAMMAGSAGPLGPASQRMREPLGRFQTSQIGYALFIRGPQNKRSYMHDGLTGGYRAQWIISPSTQEAVIALASNSHAPITRMQNLLMAGLYPPTAQPNNSALNTIGDYAGIYRVDKNTAVNFIVQNAKLYRRITGAGYRVLQPAGADTFVDADVGVQYVFQRNNGELVSLDYSQGGGGFKALKTTEPTHTHTQAITDPEKSKDYAGRYLLERSLRRNIDFDVKEEEGQLLVRSSNWQRRPVFPKPGHSDRFFYDALNAEIQFERNEQGKIVALTLHEGGVFRMPKVSD